MSNSKKTSSTEEDGKAALVPRLRFPEFRGTGEWTTETLGSVARISTEKIGDKAAIPMSITSGVGLVSQMDKFGRIIAGSSYSNYLPLEKDDFAYNKSATKEYPEGFIALYSGDQLAAVPNSIFTCFRIEGQSPVPQYLNYLFLGNLHGRWLRKFIEVGARAHGSLSINEADLLALPVPLPSGKRSVAEQQKIVECLSSLDEMIAAQARRVDALKTQKKGLMQRLFPREGETEPRLRFPEFRDDGGWEESALGGLFDDIIDFRGRTPLKLGMEWGGGNITSLSANNVKNGSIDYAAECNLGSEELYWRWMGSVNLEKDDIIFTMEAPLGNALLLPDSQKYILSQRVVALKTNTKVLNSFLIQLIWNEKFQQAISELATGSTAKGINQKALKTVPVRLPRPNEQRRIASCLSSLDALITAETEKLGALKRHKRGLMQQLFPSAEEVEA